jgi:hypothetical protein
VDYITKSNLQIHSIPHQNSNDILHINEKNPNIYMEAQKTQIANTVLSKKSNAGGIAIPDCKLYYRVMVTKTAWYCFQNGQLDQWNRIEDLELSLHIIVI